nr:signal recognition particle subunit SRP68-like [Mirounga angustirostris]
MLRFEHQEWKAAIEAFNKCKTIYEKLASAFTEEQAVLYNQRVEEISPNIRYCAYNIGDQSAINELMQMRLRSGGTEGLLAEKLEALITQTRAKQAATMSEVEWRGRTVPVKIDKVRIFLLGLADNEAAIAQVRGSCPFLLPCVSEVVLACLQCRWVFISHKAKICLNAI